MGKTIKENLGMEADRVERDHEVQMARADLYKIAKYAIKLHDMLKNVSEEQGLEGWVQAKITKSADYIGSVYHNLDYDLNVNTDMSDPVGTDEMPIGEAYGKKKDKYKEDLKSKLKENYDKSYEKYNKIKSLNKK